MSDSASQALFDAVEALAAIIIADGSPRQEIPVASLRIAHPNADDLRLIAHSLTARWANQPRTQAWHVSLGYGGKSFIAIRRDYLGWVLLSQLT